MSSKATDNNKAICPENPSMGSLASLDTPAASSESSIPLYEQLPSSPPNPSSHSFHGSAEELTSTQDPKLETPECKNRALKSSPELSESSSSSRSQFQADGGCEEEKKIGELVLGDAIAQSSPLPLPEVALKLLGVANRKNQSWHFIKPFHLR